MILSSNKRHKSLPIQKKVWVWAGIGCILTTFLIVLIFGSGVWLGKHGGMKLVDRQFENLRSQIGRYWIQMSTDVEPVVFDIKFKNYKKILETRKRNLASGIGSYTKEDWVKAKLHHNDETLPVKIRLKGIGPGHWQHDNQWSFRLNVRNKNTFLGMVNFYIVNALGQNSANSESCPILRLL